MTAKKLENPRIRDASFSNPLIQTYIEESIQVSNTQTLNKRGIYYLKKLCYHAGLPVDI